MRLSVQAAYIIIGIFRLVVVVKSVPIKSDMIPWTCIISNLCKNIGVVFSGRWGLGETVCYLIVSNNHVRLVEFGIGPDHNFVNNYQVYD